MSAWHDVFCISLSKDLNNSNTASWYDHSLVKNCRRAVARTNDERIQERIQEPPGPNELTKD